MDRKECGKCGAIWINGQHMWATGNTGNEADLAGLVCNKLGDDQCINPCRGVDTGDTWAKRLGDLETATDAKKNRMEAAREDYRNEYGEDA